MYPIALNVLTISLLTDISADIRVYGFLLYNLIICYIDDDSSTVPSFGGTTRGRRKPVFKKGQINTALC